MWPSVSQSVREVGWVPPRSPTRAAHQHQHQHQHPWARYLALGNCARGHPLLLLRLRLRLLRTFFLCAACSAVARGFMRSATCAWRRACLRRHLTAPGERAIGLRRCRRVRLDRVRVAAPHKPGRGGCVR